MKTTLQETQENNAQQLFQLPSAEDYYYQNIKPFQDRLKKLDNLKIRKKAIIQIVQDVIKQEAKLLSEGLETITTLIDERIHNLIKKHEDEPQTISQITNDYNNNLKLSTVAKQYSTECAIRGVREYHLNKWSEQQQNVFFAPVILNYLDHNSKIKTSYKSYPLQDRGKYPFALGNVFGTICDFLSNKKITLLLSTNKFLRNSVKIYKNHITLDECQNIVNTAIENRKKFLDLFSTMKLHAAIDLLESEQIIAYNDINADESNLLKIIVNPTKYLRLNDEFLQLYNGGAQFQLSYIAKIFKLIVQKWGMQDIQINGETNLLRKFSAEDLLSIINTKPTRLNKAYQEDPDSFNLSTTDLFGETILLEVLSDENPDAATVALVKSLINSGANINQANVNIGETPLHRAIMKVKAFKKQNLEIEEQLIEYLMKKGAVMDISWCQENVTASHKNAIHFYTVDKPHVGEDKYMYYNILYLKQHNELNSLLANKSVIVAIMAHYNKTATLLIESCTDINIDKCLNEAVKCLNYNATKVLIERGGNVSNEHLAELIKIFATRCQPYKNANYDTLSDMVLKCGDITKLLIESGATLDDDSIASIEKMKAETEKQIERLLWVPMMGWDILTPERLEALCTQNAIPQSGVTFMHSAKFFNYFKLSLETLSTFIEYYENGYNTDFQCLLIAEDGELIIKTLLIKKSDVEEPNSILGKRPNNATEEPCAQKRQKTSEAKDAAALQDNKEASHEEDNDDPMGSEAPSEVNDTEPLQNNDDPMNSEATHAAIESVDPAADTQLLGNEKDSNDIP
jgi:hypothetical protein